MTYATDSWAAAEWAADGFQEDLLGMLHYGNLGWDAVTIKRKYALKGLWKELAQAIDPQEEPPPIVDAIKIPVTATPTLVTAFTALKRKLRPETPVPEQLAALRATVAAAHADRLVQEDRRIRRRKQQVTLLLM